MSTKNVSEKRNSSSATRHSTKKPRLAYNDKDAIRLALYYCHLDGEDFIKIEGRKGFVLYTLCLCKINKSNLPTFEF